VRYLAGQKALVTGASSGIGRACAIALGEAGADVLVNYNKGEKAAREVVAHIERAGSAAIAHRADVSSEDEVQRMFATMIERFGTLDILVSNAGLQKDAAIDRMTLDEWQRPIAVNLTGAFLCCREAIKEFRRRGVVRSVSRAAGKVIFISSVHEVIPWAGHVNYAASKGGLMLLMKSLAQEVAPDRIRVNSVSPGAIKTGINREAWGSDEARRELLELIPYGRIGEPEDVARAVLFLASDDSDYVTGTSLVVDGGMTLYPAFASGG